MLNNDSSFSSKQELLDLQDVPVGFSLDSPSPVGSSLNTPISSALCSPAGDAPVGTVKQAGGHPDTPVGVNFLPSDSQNLCGWGALTPRCIQIFNTPRWMLFFLCVASFLQGMIINGFINTVITSIERRFDLRSYQVGEENANLFTTSRECPCLMCFTCMCTYMY